MFFIPRDASQRTLNTGFISQAQSDADGKFIEHPVVTIVQEAACLYHGVRFTFGYALPSGIVIRTYNDGELVEEYPVVDEIVKNLTVFHTFDDFDTMEIEFTGTAEPYNRIVLNNFAFGDITDFTMERHDMLSSPKAIKQELVKEVIVPCYTYMANPQEETLIGEEISVQSDEVVTFFVGEPSYDYRLLVNDEQSSIATIIDSSSYYVTIQFTTAGTYRVDVMGHRYKIVERYATRQLNLRGKSVKWENPLISDISMAVDLAEWLGDYYSSNIEYEYDSRGNPEIDANDVIYQENDFYEGMKVTVYRQSLIFNQSFKGKIAARRMIT